MSLRLPVFVFAALYLAATASAGEPLPGWERMPPVILGRLDASATEVFGDDFGITELSLTTGVLAPRDPRWIVSSGIDLRFLDAPAGVDVPETLYGLTVDFMYRDRWNDDWAYQLAITPGIFTDFADVDGDALRITGRALATGTINDQLSLVLGVIYLDRDDVPVLPALGLTYTPTPDDVFELLFPRPKYKRRFAAGVDAEVWGYVGGEFGGGQWQVERADGMNDELILRDFRLLLGVERKAVARGGMSWRIEGGYVFGREVEFDSEVGEFSPDSGFLVRAGLSR